MTSILMTIASIKAEPAVVSSFKGLAPAIDALLPFKCIPYIHYLVHFKKNQVKTQALIDSDSKVNAITWSYVTKLGLKIRVTDVRAQKIDGFTLETFGMVLVSF